MESLTAYVQLLQTLRQRLVEQAEALTALKGVLALEAEHLRRHDQAVCLHDLGSRVMQEVEGTQQTESDAASSFKERRLIGGVMKFTLGALGAAVAGRQAPLSVGAQLASTEFERKQPYGTLLVAVGPGGIPDEVHVVAVSRLARESRKTEAEIEAALQAGGCLLVAPHSFFRVMEQLENAAARGVLTLPVPRDSLFPKAAEADTKQLAGTGQCVPPPVEPELVNSRPISEAQYEIKFLDGKGNDGAGLS